MQENFSAIEDSSSTLDGSFIKKKKKKLATEQAESTHGEPRQMCLGEAGGRKGHLQGETQPAHPHGTPWVLREAPWGHRRHPSLRTH